MEARARTLARLASNDAMPVSKILEFLGVLSLRDEQQAWSGLRLIVDTLPTIAEAPLVLIIDAFEEVYSLCPDRDERDLFVANLLHAASAWLDDAACRRARSRGSSSLAGARGSAVFPSGSPESDLM